LLEENIRCGADLGAILCTTLISWILRAYERIFGYSFYPLTGTYPDHQKHFADRNEEILSDDRDVFRPSYEILSIEEVEKLEATESILNEGRLIERRYSE
jgi:hypothetical protein